MEQVLRNVANKEGFDPDDLMVQQVIQDSNGNVRKAILVLEALKMQEYVSFFFLIFFSSEHVSLDPQVFIWQSRRRFLQV